MNNTLLFYDETFPFHGERPGKLELQQLLQFGRIVDADSLEEVLKDKVLSGDRGCLVNLHGTFFPKKAWNDILQYLKLGGGLLNIGGAPFKLPVSKEHGIWISGLQQTAYHQQIQIHEALEVDALPIQSLVINKDLPIIADYAKLFSIEPTYGFILHPTKASDLPNENGSSGPMDVHIYPLLKGVSKEGREVAAPIVLLENTKGDFAGGRWMFINQHIRQLFWANGGAEAIGKWAAFCSCGVTEIWIKPNYACYQPGDQAQLTLQLQDITSGERCSANAEWTFSIEIYKEIDGVSEQVGSCFHKMKTSKELVIQQITLPMSIEKALYRIQCTAVSNTNETRILRQGFWGLNEDLLQEGTPVSCDRDYFWKNGRPLPVVGMTYMTSDVARKFIFMPNVSVWDQDMAQMKKAGINWIRTGIWTAWRNVMFVDGHPSEEVLRAIDAFILTAKKYDLEVTFTFFAFTPEAWEGSNPYLDPRSIAAQKRFISALVSRHKRSTNVQWDLINEPSLFDPLRIFAGPRPVSDRYELEAYRKWLQARHGSIEALQDRWGISTEQLPNFASIIPPEQSEMNFDIQDMRRLKKGTRWLDYTLFTMEIHNRWAKQLTETIKSINPNQLVTVGQDEALKGLRPSPFFYAEAVDYTTVHTWWLNDDLVWDGIFAKSSDKPSLIQETGIMYVETPDNRAKRSETELRNILERKYAYAFSTGGAGAIQWLWNTNFYMDNINESNIGAIRADGTEKPEADISYDFGRFMSEAQDIFVNREMEDIVVVYPYSNDFSNRRLAYDATTKLTRVFTYELKIPFRAIGEYHLDSLKPYPPQLLIVPSAHNFSEEALNTIIQHISEEGGILLFTGPLGLDEYWRPNARLKDAVGDYQLKNVVREEMMALGEKVYPVSFGQRRIAEVCKESGIDGSNVKEVVIGKGKLIWCSVPVELNERSEPLAALYSHAIKCAGIERDFVWIKGGGLPGVYGRRLSFQNGYLFIFVSEYALDVSIEIMDPKVNKNYGFLLASERAVLFAADKEGNVTSVYRPNEVKIQIEGRDLHELSH